MICFFHNIPAGLVERLSLDIQEKIEICSEHKTCSVDLTDKIKGAGLDVFHKEPLEPKSPLWKMENVIISPHNGGATPHYNERAIRLFKENYTAYRTGKVMPNEVNMELKY